MASSAPEAKGRHKVFLGMAAGVGKTYRMLQEGRSELEAGRDTAIGYLETHNRPETAEQAEGLEVIPRRRVTYRDSELEEMDLPAVLAALARALPDRRDRPHERARPGAREALRGRRRRRRRRHRCLLDRQRAAPGEPQRPGRRADRRARPGDAAGLRARCRRRSRPDRPHARGAARAPARRQDLPGRAANRGRAPELLQDREPLGPARGRAAPGGRGGRVQAPRPRDDRHARRPADRHRGAAGRRRAPPRARQA